MVGVDNMSTKIKTKNLIETWSEVEQNINQRSFGKALDSLNKKMKTSYTTSRVNEWKENRNGRGERLPRELRVHLSKVVLKNVLSNAGLDTSKLTQKNLNRIVEQLN